MNLNLVRSILQMQNHLRHFPLATQFTQLLFLYYFSEPLYLITRLTKRMRYYLVSPDLFCCKNRQSYTVA